MEILIREPRFQAREKYLVKVSESHEEWVGQNIGFFVFDHIQIFRDGIKVIEAKRRYRPFSKIYFNVFYNGLQGYLKLLTRFKPSYSMVLPGVSYDIIEHWGKKVSVFQESIQVASLVQINDLSFNDKNTLRLLVENRIDFIPLILLAIIMDIPGNKSSGRNMLTFDLGNITGEKRPFNHQWKPANL